MGWFVFGIVLLLCGAVIGVCMKKSGDEDIAKYKNIPVVTGCLLFVLFLAISCLATVNTGNTGIVTVYGRVSDTMLDAGFHMKAPWEKVIEMDNRVQKSTVDLSCFSSDIQEVSCAYTLNYQIDKQNAQTIYKTIGKNYYDTVIVPNVAESVKTVVARYTAEELIGSRDMLASAIEEILSEQLKRYNIELVSTAIEDLDFTDTFTNAVEAKQVAAQNKLKAEIEQAQAIKQAQADAEVDKTKAEAAATVAKVKAEADAEVAQIQAKADLEVQKINADAAEYTGQKEAAKNKAINESLTGDLLKYYLINQWDGKYPTTYMGNGDISALIDINK